MAVMGFWLARHVVAMSASLALLEVQWHAPQVVLGASLHAQKVRGVRNNGAEHKRPTRAAVWDVMYAAVSTFQPVDKAALVAAVDACCDTSSCCASEGICDGSGECLACTMHETANYFHSDAHLANLRLP